MDNYQRTYLRNLAIKVRDIALQVQQEEKISLWKKTNSLKKVRPLVHFIPAPQIMQYFISDNELLFQDELLKSVEKYLKWKIYKSENFNDDEPITLDLYIPLHKKVTPWMEGYRTVRMGKNFESSHFEPCIVEYSDAKKMQMPNLIIDWEKSNEEYGIVQDLLGDILNVTQGNPYDQTTGWGESMIDELVEMRGLENIYTDFYDDPNFIHETMEFMTEGKLSLLRQYEEQKAFYLNNKGNNLGSCGQAFCDDLPGTSYDESNILPKNLWGFAQAQELSEVSPEMLETFILPYQSRILKHFGLNLYGCCEAMENKVESLEKHIPNLRMISISPFTNHQKAAEKIKDKYVYAWKQNPTCMVNFNESYIENELRNVFEITKACRVYVVLMDTYEFGNDINRFKKWIEIALKVSNEFS